MNRDCQLIHFYICTVIITIFAGAVYLYSAVHLPVYDIYLVPDEACRRMIPFYIVENGILPTGYELSLNAANDFGFSYASYPPFPALVSAFFIKAASFFSSNDMTLIIASRLGNVLFGALSAIFMMKLGYCFFSNIMAAVLCTIIVSFMPQVIFISSYFNADSFSLFSVIMILYYLLTGKKDGWKFTTCFKLALAMSICILTYYNAYSFCLIAVLFCIISCIQNKSLNRKEKSSLILSRGIQVTLILVLLAGWYFIRNYFLYNGDFLAISMRDKIAQMTYAQGYQVHFCKPFINTGKSLSQMLFNNDGFTETTLKSLIGVFGAMNIFMSSAIYFIFGIILVSGLLCSVYHCIKDRKNYLFYISIIAASIITVFLSVFYSYKIDYEPQGRYIISILPGLAVFSVIGFRQIATSIYIFIKRIKFKFNISMESVEKTLMKYISILWIIILVHIYYTVVDDKVFTHDKLSYTISNSEQELSFNYLPSEFKSYSAVNFAIWRPETEPPLWYAAKNIDSDWRLSWQWKHGEADGDYAVHIYGVCKNGKYKKLYEKNFSLSDNMIIISR